MSEAAVRRCRALLLQASEQPALDFAALLTGGDAVRTRQSWQALASHLGRVVELDSEDVRALSQLSESGWTARAACAEAMGEARLSALIEHGLVLVEDAASTIPASDAALLDPPWHALAAAAHMFSRWSGVDSLAAQEASRIQSTADLIAEYGPPPPHHHTRADAQQRLDLQRPPPDALDALMARRATCRNFATDAHIAPADLAVLMHRVFGEQGREAIAPGAVALKKNHPSGGGLHPLEAYLIVQRVQDVPAGLYHYNVEAHALDRLSQRPIEDIGALALTAVAGQDYFAAAPVLLVIAARFARSYWKYRAHPKIHRAIVLEAGHASQNLYLAATECGWGAYVTAAINEVEIEQAFGLDPLQEGVIAVCGFGPRPAQCSTVELDPQNAVWDETGQLVAVMAREGSAGR
ncbi:MAG: putative peptide maturation dehydrogenase [Dokdonella sp.]